MGRLIDEDAVKRRMHETMDYQDLYLPVHFEMCMNDVPTVEPASPWHRVEEPPKKDGKYLVYIFTSDWRWEFKFAGYLHGRWIGAGGGDVCYWTPIEPPKEDA